MKYNLNLHIIINILIDCYVINKLHYNIEINKINNKIQNTKIKI